MLAWYILLLGVARFEAFVVLEDYKTVHNLSMYILRELHIIKKKIT